MDDWRLTPTNESQFRGAVFTRKAYVPSSPSWDHDHCSFCWAEFLPAGVAAHEEPTFHEGYATVGPPANPRPDYYWVCPTCFEDFRERLEWTTRPATGESDSL